VVPKTRWAKTVDGAYVAYQDFGEGSTTIIVIHGWISHLEVYWEQPRFARFMQRMASGMRVLHFDKRGSGLSDRITRSPDLETRMDDVRAVMDSAGVERAVVYGWGSGGPMLAAFFAATYPDRTVALCLDGSVRLRWAPDFPWGWTDDLQDRDLSALIPVWGDEDGVDEFIRQGFGEERGAAPITDPEFRRWSAKFARHAATPGSYEAFDRMWFETDVRDVLPAVRVPTLVIASPENYADEAEYMAQRIAGAKVVRFADRKAVVPWVEDPEPYVAEIERFLTAVREEEDDLDRVLATVLFTDIVRSTETAATLGDRGWLDLVERHHTAVRALLGRYRGVEMDTAGDGFFATFDGPARAVRCAKAILEAIAPLGIEIRVGIHTGEVERVDHKVGGIAVNIGARVGAIAGPSEILVSQTVRDLVAGSGLHFEDRGTHHLKGVPDQWHLYRAS
jgi:class 3 adenylate cyclase/alpha-beta hydrolase superfamily lysophospholipase